MEVGGGKQACRAQLTLSAYFIYKYGFTAQEVIGFMRIVRPGMVVGGQQHFMLLNQMKWAGWVSCVIGTPLRRRLLETSPFAK